MNKRIFSVVMSALMLANMTACKEKKEEKAEPQSSAVVETTAPTTEAPTEPVEEYINPLTGETGYNADAIGKRPVAVMVNNLKAALPQYGITEADIIYEVPVEGGITRLMAVYADYTNVPDVCSVRSCRYYYPIIALGLDAVYCHWGADQTIALETLKRTGIDHLDGGSETGLFYRDENRVGKYDSEHTGYMKGSEIPQTFEKHGFRTDVNSDNIGGGLNFISEGETVSDENALSCSELTLKFSDTYFSTFEYNEVEKVYYKKHSENPHMDGVTNEQLSFENVFAIQTSIKSRDGYLMDVQLVGKGTGYYATNGKIQMIEWVKASEDSPIRIYNQNGEPLEINIGESYFGIIGTDKTISFS